MSNQTVFGYAGKILRVDLSSEKITQERLDDATRRKYIGGTGMGARYLYQEVPPGVEWSDAENRIMFFSGPLSGTRVSGSGIFSVIGKGPMTNLAGTSQANGYFGAYMKLSGYDGIVIQGKAGRWLYLYIHDGTAELRDASQLLGKDTWETEDAIKQETGKQSSVYGIGPAGENLVRFACIAGDHGHVAGHNGLGAVMGSKKLKAVVAKRGNIEIPLADPERLSKTAREFITSFQEKNPGLSRFGTLAGFAPLHKFGQLPVRNYTTNVFPEVDKFTAEYLRTHFKVTPTTCWACPVAHTRLTEVTEGPYKGFIGEEPEYEGMAAVSSQMGQTDPGAAVMLGNQIDRLGVDINESGWLFGWLMECYEKGYLKAGDLDGVEMKWGDAEAVLAILKKISRREGCGSWLAEGVKRASERMGGEALNCAINAQKGSSPRGHDHRARWAEMMDTCLSNTSTVEVGPGIPIVPELGMKPVKDAFDVMEVSAANAMVNGRRIFEDSLAVCILCNPDLQVLVDLLNAATGWDFTLEEAMTAGKRIVNNLRVFNFRHGLTKEMETPSLRYGSVPVDGPAKGRSIMPQWEALRSNYYLHMGWDPVTGKPLPETLEKLGLGHLIPALG